MTDINWDRFAARVPAGTRVRSIRNCIYSDELGAIDVSIGQQGLMMRCGREITHYQIRFPKDKDPRIGSGPVETWDDGPIVQFFDHLTDKRIPHYHIEYLIDGRWLTFHQVMEG